MDQVLTKWQTVRIQISQTSSFNDGHLCGDKLLQGKTHIQICQIIPVHLINFVFRCVTYVLVFFFHLTCLALVTAALSLLERPKCATAPPSACRKSLASQMGFCSTLKPRDFCVCIPILTQWVEIIFIVFFLREGSEIVEPNAFKQFFKKQKTTFLKCQLLPAYSSDSRKTRQHLHRSVPPWKQWRNYTLRCDR